MIANKNNELTITFIVMFVILLAAAFLVGISDNPPGLILCYLATASLILAFVHRWRKLKSFLILLGASIIGFLVFVILHNVFYAFAEIAVDITILNYLLEFLHAVFFLIAVLVCPTGLLIGTIGIAAVFFKKETITHE